ncbi:diacylglycerol kinase family lipid kinase [Heyndrickxia oleronia]|uniref:DAGKc domain-containing protein n=1 Tax=Heyndrickxia oleronia TaxID=38875 RepID=A0A8E2LDN5_9BACI|nr:diacylglycerol kinase family protein [Heyndrickxia oleronia]MEC1374098.1 diacylglycerol kinase family lipid kinase [Heyndrickxia oleronia]OOP66309.1 hypothetical protein BWZ43_21660 [Heyndrickxia oleronia]QQZ06310.1 diacylglycerol kinase family lipid kinase [Heyndrickxia oleronia]
MEKRLVFIVNPSAKNGVSKKIWNKLNYKLDNIPYEVFYTKHQKHAQDLAHSIALSISDPILMVAVGGDGTIHEVINGVVSFQHVTIAYIPAGSGNDFAKGYKLPIKPDECLAHLLQMKENEGVFFDTGKYTNKTGQGHFVNSLGAGFDASITRRVNSSFTKKWLNFLGLGKLVYALFMLIELFRYRPTTIYLVINGVEYTFERAWFVTISNQAFYGGGMKISPLADPGDGELNITVVSEISRIMILFIFLSVFWGGHIKFKAVHLLKGTDILIHSTANIPVHADGEFAGETPVQIKVCPHSWKLIKTYENVKQLIA